MRILAIETSCDETAVAILECNKKKEKISARGGPAFGWKILSDIVASQVKIHAPWGGVVPNLAKREHQKNLPIILKKALKDAKLSLNPPAGGPKIDLIAVTNGPGLEPALWVGINFSQDLAKKWKKPLIGINHLEGHIFSVLLSQPKKIIFPALALVVSGGHTELVLMNPPAGGGFKYRVIGQTLDDAAGEAFDKVARLLGLGYPGGPAIAKAAENFKRDIKFTTVKDISYRKIQLPRPMINSKDYNFSFSGLKTAVLYKIKELGQLTTFLKAEMAAEFQQAVIDCLIKKTIRAAKEYRVKTVILGGGVAANKELRRQLEKAIEEINFENRRCGRAPERSEGRDKRFSKFDFRNKLNLLMPEMEFTGDNAAMIALAAYFRTRKRKTRQLAGGVIPRIVADSNLKLE